MALCIDPIDLKLFVVTTKITNNQSNPNTGCRFSRLTHLHHTDSPAHQQIQMSCIGSGSIGVRSVARAIVRNIVYGMHMMHGNHRSHKVVHNALTVRSYPVNPNKAGDRHL